MFENVLSKDNINNISSTKKLRNNSIDIFRFICAILVLMAHTNPTEDKVYFIEEIIVRIAVPFFFVTSGYFYLSKLQSNSKNAFSKQIKSLLKIYVTWSFIYLAKDLILAVYNGNSIVNVLIDFVKNFFINGSSYQFWFFPALFFATITATLFYKIGHLKILAYGSIFIYIIGLFGTSYFGIGTEIPLLSSFVNFHYFYVIRRLCLLSVPLFMMGYFIPAIMKKFKINWIHIIMIFIPFVAEIALVNYFSLNRDIIITIFLYPLTAVVFITLMNNPMPNFNRCGAFCKKMSDFIYCVHPINITVFALMKKGLNFDCINLWLFIFTLLTSVLEGIIWIYVISPKINKIHKNKTVK